MRPATAAPPAYGASAIADRDGYPVFTVNGAPFFLWGAAFFYERLPRERWRSALEALRALHVNTLDLYVPWNWHEIAEGNFDFTGATSPRRDLRGLLTMARELGFYFVVRPGPVIRNEWRNGGYPAWLLARSEYGMPLHDVLEGRYPATATLQNARSDDAAAEWSANATHMRFAERWLRRALAEFAPVADRVLAIQLDDDQGAYLTNQTWPAPHLRAYLERLAAIVHAATDSRVPVFINTYQMKVTASSPVWAMGNWYQSDALRIGEHDRAQLAFSTALLGTRPHQPLLLSEFQAGWLLAPEDVYPRRADPANTLLALHTALGEGARGVIDFPMQDTLAPTGWEAPFANWFYAWDAALGLDEQRSARYAPTRAFGELVERDGAALAATHLVADAAIVWWPSAVDERTLTDDEVNTIAGATIEAQRACRARELICALVDARFADEATLAHYRALIVPALPVTLTASERLNPAVRARLDAFARRGALLRSLEGRDADALVNARAVRGMPGATLHAGRVGNAVIAFLDVANYDAKALHGSASVRLDGATRAVAVDVPARSAVLLRLDGPQRSASATPLPSASPQILGIPLRRDAWAPASALIPVAPGATAFEGDLFRDGSYEVALQNERVRVVVAPQAGGRAFVFEDRAHRTSAFSTVGALRDDVSIQPPPSATDRIAKYTHTFPAGTFNRPYVVAERGSEPARVTLTYDAPDVVPGGARFEKTLTLLPHSDALEVSQRLIPGPGGEAQRLVVYSSLAIGNPAAEPWAAPVLLPGGAPLVPRTVVPLGIDGPFALYDPRTREFVSVRWPRGAVEKADLDVRDRHAVLRLRLAPGAQSSCYEYAYLSGEAEARARLASDAREGGQGGGVAERSTQSPQKRPSESSCGFKSHLPQ